MMGNYKDRIHAWLLLLLFSGAIVSSVWHDVHLWQSYPKASASATDSKQRSEASALHFQAHHCVLCDFQAVAYDIPNDIQAVLTKLALIVNVLISIVPQFFAAQRVDLLPARAPPFLI